jgi:hypothetical protein
MTFHLIPDPPPGPSPQWAGAFAAWLIDLKPYLSWDAAIRCAALAHNATWLLEPEEAAEWWVAAIEAATKNASI